MKSDFFPPGAWHHVYTITKDGGVLFYRITDRLSFYTVMSVLTRRHRMTVLGVSIMFTHLHFMLKAVDITHLRSYIGDVLSTFSRIVNQDRDSRGAVFRRPFGRAVRCSEKEKRASLIYLYNNPVEKKLCQRAIEDRWTFLAYARNTFPFSATLVKRNVRHALRSACDVVDREYRAGRYLRPAMLRELFRNLFRTEQEQLTDYIIQKYQFIDHREAIGLFDDLNALLLATDASSGKEFDVGENFDPSSDVAYREMCSLAARNGLFENWKLLHLSPDERAGWARNFQLATGASRSQVRKFLHSEEKP